MKRTLWAGFCAGMLLALSVGLVKSAPSAGTTLSVRSLHARIMRQPQFLGRSVADLKRGYQVTMVRAKGPWYLVSYQGQQGWIHRNRVTKQIIKLRSGSTGSGTTRGEAELAGRGFSPKTESNYQTKNPSLDYSHLDKIQTFDVEPDEVAKFAAQGGVQRKSGGGS